MRQESPHSSDISLNHTIKNVRSLYLMNQELAEDFMDNPKMWQKLFPKYLVGLHETLILDEMLRRLHLGTWDKMFGLSPGLRILPEFDFWNPLK